MAGGYGIHEYPQIARDKEVLLVTIRAAKSAPKLSFVTLLITPSPLPPPTSLDRSPSPSPSLGCPWTLRRKEVNRN